MSNEREEAPLPVRPLATLARPAFANWVAARVAAGTAVTLLRAVFLWQVYDVSHSTFYLGLVGLLQFVPAPIASLVGGSIADARDRRSIVVVSQALSLGCSAALALLSHFRLIELPLLLALVVVAATAASFESPARQAMLPTLVPANELAGAVTVFVTANALAFMSGPAVGGLILGHVSVAAAYATAAGLYLASIALVSRVPRSVRPADAPKRPVDIASIKEGIDFVRREPVLLGCMTLDMFAVLFGGAAALLPVYANDILHVGPKGYGLLTSSLEIGGLLTSLVLLGRRPIRRLGRALVACVAAFGVATIVFGLSRWFLLSVVAYLVVGMADQVSVVVRGTIVQQATPDELRGRVSSVNMLFIGASNQLGAAESGFLASLTSATFSVVAGGALCLVVVAAMGLVFPKLVTYREGPR